MKSTAVTVEIHLMRAYLSPQKSRVSVCLDFLPRWLRPLFRCALWVSSWTCTGWIETSYYNAIPCRWHPNESGRIFTVGPVTTGVEVIPASGDGSGCWVKPNKGR